MIAAALFGLLLGLGIWVVVRGIVNPPKFATRAEIQERLTMTLTPLNSLKNQSLWVLIGKVAAAIAAGLLVFWMTRWLAAGAMGFIVAWFGPQVLLGMKLRRQAIARVESVALWAEQLRDLVTAGGSVSGSILLSAPYSPAPIRQPIQKLSEEMLAFGLPEALKRFAIRSDSSYVDRLTLGLKIADDSGARLRELLDDLASALRASVEVRFRMETTQTRTLLNGGLILVITLVLAVVINIISPDYFDAYYGFVGQTVLMGVVLLYLMAVLTIMQIDRERDSIRLLDHLEKDEKAGELVW